MRDNDPNPRKTPSGRAGVLRRIAIAATVVLVIATVVIWKTWPSAKEPPAPNTAIRVGLDGWLFYEPDIAHITGPGFLEKRDDPVRAIAHFNQQLQSRGIQLIIVPTPAKPAIHPEKVPLATTRPAVNPALSQFQCLIESHGILVFDATGVLSRAASEGRSQFLVTDTHWRPEAAELVARELAHFVNEQIELPQSLGVEYQRQDKTIQGIGDLAERLEPRRPASPESVTIHPVIQPGGQPWAPAKTSEILWLGDSFSTIYSTEQMAFGAAAGIVEQFSFHLGRPVDALRRNDNGASATRQMLSDELARGIDRLAGKKLVIWQFAARELSFGDWQRIDLALRAPPAPQFIIPPHGQSWIISGIVAAKGAVPRPGHVAYRDHIMAIRLTGVAVENQTHPGNQAVVYLRSMTNLKLTPAASLQIGQRIRIKVRDWSEVSRQFDLIHRSDLPDQSLRTQPPCWGELLP